MSRVVGACDKLGTARVRSAAGLFRTSQGCEARFAGRRHMILAIVTMEPRGGKRHMSPVTLTLTSGHSRVPGVHL